MAISSLLAYADPQGSGSAIGATRGGVAKCVRGGGGGGRFFAPCYQLCLRPARATERVGRSSYEDGSVDAHGA